MEGCRTGYQNDGFWVRDSRRQRAPVAPIAPTGGCAKVQRVMVPAAGAGSQTAKIAEVVHAEASSELDLDASVGPTSAPSE